MKKKKFILILLLLSVCCFSQSRYISNTTKKIVFARDNGVCQCCGSSFLLEYDHVTPYSCGGSSDASNIQLLCRTCNRSKSNSCYCKKHNNRVGTNCCDGSVSKNNATSSSRQCMGTTKKGGRCKKKTKDSSGFCNFHQ